MSWCMAALYDWFTRRSEEACLQAWRAELLARVHGRVLEVGAGTGASLSHYGPAVEQLVLAEPDRYMRKRLAKRLSAASMSHVKLLDSPLEALGLPDESFDFVVSTLVLCSVGSLEESLAEIRRVLKPGGGLVFLEHVAAEDRPQRLKWQRRIEPLWQRVMGNCHLTRRTATAIAKAGFVIDELEKESIRKAVPIVRSSVRGIARKPG